MCLLPPREALSSYMFALLLLLPGSIYRKKLRQLAVDNARSDTYTKVTCYRQGKLELYRS